MKQYERAGWTDAQQAEHEEGLKPQPDPVRGRLKVEWTCPVCSEMHSDDTTDFVRRGLNLETQCPCCKTDVPVDF